MTMMSKRTMRNGGGPTTEAKVIPKRKFMRKMEWILKIKEMVLCLLKQGHKKIQNCCSSSVCLTQSKPITHAYYIST